MARSVAFSALCRDLAAELCRKSMQVGARRFLSGVAVRVCHLNMGCGGADERSRGLSQDRVS